MKRVEDFTVLKVRWLNYSSFIIELQAPDGLPDIRAGHFAELQVSNSPIVFLRRPFSFLDADAQSGKVSFFIKVIGEGTRLLGSSRVGDKISIIYPLGNSFRVPQSGPVLIVGGGSGIAPFILLGRALHEKGIPVTFLFGGRTAEDIVLREEFGRYGPVLMTTEDGSAGEKGLVTQHSVFSGDPFPFTHLAVCGPDPMMKAVAAIARQKNVSCEVSLENTMACGFGACLCCITETVNGNKCVCTEGPVFNINDLKW